MSVEPTLMDNIKSFSNKLFEGKNLVILTIACVIVFLITFSMSIKSVLIFMLLAIFGVLFYLFRDKLKFMLFGGSVKIMVFAIILLIIISGIGYSVIKIYEKKAKINADWAKYKCKPYVLPFAGWLIGPGSTSPTSNFVDCMWVLNKSFFDVLISPFVDMFDVLVDIVKGFNDDIQNVRQMISYLRQNLATMAEDIYKKIYDDYARLSYLFQKVMQIFSKVFNIFEDYFKVLEAIFYTLASITSPLRSVVDTVEDIGKFFCFHPEMEVILSDNSSISIKDIIPGMMLKDGNKVIATLKINARNSQMYDYNDIIVSGNHLVFNDSKLKHVYEIDEAIPVRYDEQYIYCLTTSKHIIEMKGGIIFADYWGQDMKMDVIKAGTKIRGYLSDRMVEEVKIGDKLKGNNEVIGIVKLEGGYNMITEHNSFETEYGMNIDFDITSNRLVNKLLEQHAKEYLKNKYL